MKFGFVNGDMKVKLGDVCEKGTSNLKQSDVVNKTGNYPVYGAAGYLGNIDFYHQEKPYIAVVKDGAGIGRVTLHPAKSSVIGTMQYLLPKENVMVEYLGYAIRYMHLEKYFTGATIPHIYFKDYKNEEFNLDTIDRQIKIVDILKKVENIIKAREQELENLDKFIKARFVEMFGDEKDFLAKAQNKVSDICKSRVGIVIQPTQYYTDEPNGVRAFRSLNVKPFYINDSDWVYFSESDNGQLCRTQVREGDVAVVRTGANLGDCCVIPKKYDGCNAIDILLLTCNDNILPMYLSAFINYPVGKQQIINVQRGGAIKHLNLKQLENSRIYVPEMELQQQFVNFVNQVDKSKLLEKIFCVKSGCIFLFLLRTRSIFPSKRLAN